MSDIVDLILPRRRVHLVTGPSGSGKTRFILESMVRWSKGEDFFGFRSFPEPWLYVSADRSKEEAESTIASLGITQDQVPLLPAYATGSADTLDWEKIFNKVLVLDRRVVVWEGFGRYVGANPKGYIIDRFLERMIYQAQKHDLTIIGIVEEPKMKPKDRYGNPRQRISGPVAWGHHCSTVITIEPLNEKDPSNPQREIWIIPHEKNVAPLRILATLAGGHVTMLPPEPDELDELTKSCNV